MGKVRLFLTVLFLAVVFTFIYASETSPRILVLLSTELDSAGATKGYIFREIRMECLEDVCIGSDTYSESTVLTFSKAENGIVLNDQLYEVNSLELKGKVKVLSAKRATGNPVYEDTIIVRVVENGLVLFNELDIESYVKYVVPSEVPSWFEKEAIKAQSIVARSRALADIVSGAKERFFGAHCDDSTSSQVFNNQVVSDIVRTCVDETEGEVILVNGEPIDTVVYFSTSSGFTSNSEEVWSDQNGNFPGLAVPYLRAKQQFDGALVGSRDENFWLKFFMGFWGVEKELLGFYDIESPWFRWKVTMSREELEQSISKGLVAREKADQALKIDAVRTLEGKAIDVNDPNFSIGELKDLMVVRRGEGGVVMTLQIIAENGVYEVDKEYNIRFVIRPTKSITGFPRDIVLERHASTVVYNYSILPSGYFAFVIERIEGKISQVTFYGGGNGHGVGMSQYGANYLAKKGRNYYDILNAFYKGEIVKMY
ncbi:MAG: SpoIID/LytB domain-containing protein [Fervidobacterium sp.]|uniref:SpoIID/LytB domain-containing protein n=1 Tax=Fervidobacterium sp. TaxID=1871331 RepID=UPI00404A51AF